MLRFYVVYEQYNKVNIMVCPSLHIASLILKKQASRRGSRPISSCQVLLLVILIMGYLSLALSKPRTELAGDASGST
jgi:hypothetical protein